MKAGKTVKKLVGISIGPLQNKYGDALALEIAARIGADAVDFDLSGKRCNKYEPQSVYSKGEDAIVEYYSGLRQKADSLGLVINQTHGKLPGFKNIPEEDDALAENTRLDCLASSVLGAQACVVHNATSIFLGPDAPAELMHSLSRDMFTRIVPYAREYGIKIATETFGDAVEFAACDFFGNIEEFEKAYAEIKSIEELSPYFTVCVDTGHSNKAMRYNNPTPADVIRRLGKEVTLLHLNDNDTFTDQHKIPKTGCIDWDDVFNALDEVGYSGVYNMELNLRHFGESMMTETAEFAVKVMKNMLKERYGE